MEPTRGAVKSAAGSCETAPATVRPATISAVSAVTSGAAIERRRPTRATPASSISGSSFPPSIAHHDERAAPRRLRGAALRVDRRGRTSAVAAAASARRSLDRDPDLLGVLLDRLAPELG